MLQFGRFFSALGASEAQPVSARSAYFLPAELKTVLLFR